MRTRRFSSALTAFALFVLVACDETLKPPPRSTTAVNFAATATDGCGASFTMITNEQDSLMSTYGIPATQDTINVCETWTGTDYVVSARVVGSSEWDVAVRDTIQQVSYANGSVAGFAASGASVGDPAGVGGSGADATTFGFLGADSGLRQASYDAPYYAIAAPSEGISTQPLLSPSAVAAPSKAPNDHKYQRHGLSRHGVRALVDAQEEIARSPEGYRRFRRAYSDREEIISIDTLTELILGEETRFSDGRVTRTRHEWTHTDDGWIKTRTDIDSDERAHDATYRSHSSIEYVDVHFDGALPPL